MHNIRHILRLHTQRQTQKEIITQTGILRSVLKKYIEDFKKSGLSFSEINELSDKDLEELFPKPPEIPQSEKHKTLYGYFPYVDKELKRKRVGVTMRLLWEEYKKKHPDGVSQSKFVHHFSQWKSRITPVLRKEHKAGDKLYIDFAGKKLSLTRKNGKKVPVEVFVAILGASQLTYVEALMTQQKEDFLPACENALHYFGGVPGALVPDNLKSAVTKADRYEPTINETFENFAEHYNTTIYPARASKPTDKALVEIAINIIYTRIYARLRNMKFSTLEELNAAIAPLLEEHNNQIVSGRSGSRRKQFEDMERPQLVQLPMLRYEFKKQSLTAVLKNGHVCLAQDKHYYSVPYAYIGKRVKVMYSRYNVEVFHQYERIAIHKRLKAPYKYTTDKEHLPPAHRFVSEITSDRLLTEADEIHKDVRMYISKIMEKTPHLDHAHRLCMGVLSLARKFGSDRLIQACQRGLEYRVHDYKTIRRILERGLEKPQESVENIKIPVHENIRGKDYYK